MKIKQLLLATTLGSLVVTSPLHAGEQGHDDGMDQSTMNHSGMSQSMMNQGSQAPQMFLEKREIDGYTVSFHVMAAAEGMGHGGSHNLMVKVEQQGQVIGDLKANSKVTYPDGKDESKALMKMGDWFMAGYDLQSSGKHQLMVLFKTADGKKHFGGVHYPGR
jgi:hypothetical protein